MVEKMNRISSTFEDLKKENKCAFIGYVTGGDPSIEKTSELVPLCHPLIINQIDVVLDIDEELPGIQIEASVITDGKTGVEMEALTAVSIAALTIYDMVKAVEKSAQIEKIRLVEKRGGMSGDVFNE